MALIKCKECGKEVSDKATKCIHCGAPIESEVKNTCPDCGKQYMGPKCMNCGYSDPEKTIESTTDKKGDKKNLIGGILALIILGGLLVLNILNGNLFGGMFGKTDISGTYVDSETGCKLIINSSSASLKCDIVNRNDNFIRYKITKADDPYSDYDVKFYYDNNSDKGVACYIGKGKTNKSISCQFSGEIVNFYKN